MSECRGCGEAGGDCDACLATTTWSIPCGCGKHGDHLGCDKVCKQYGECHHPLGLEMSGSLEESETYDSSPPPRHMVKRAIEQERARVQKKLKRKLLKLERLELALDEYPA